MMLANTDLPEKGIILAKNFINFLVTQLIIDYHLGMQFTCSVVLTGRNFDLSLKIRS